MTGVRHIFQRHSGLVILTLALAITFVILYLARNIILPFLVGLVIAYILLPVVSWLERRFRGRGRYPMLKRTLAIIIVFILILLALGTAGYYIVTATIDSVVTIVKDAPEFLSRAFDTIQGWFESLREWLPEGASEQIDSFIRDAGGQLGNAFRGLFSNIATAVPGTVSYIMGFATLPIFLFYILKDREHLSERFYSWLPGSAAAHLRNVAGIIRDVLGGYLRAQLTMGLFVGILALIGLLIIRAPLAPGLAVIAGVTELVPILGPWIGGGIAVLITLATAPDKVLWVIVLFFGIQIVENTLLVPRIQGHYLHVHPAVAVVLIIVGASVAGFWGLILIVPLASTVVQLYRYVTRAAREQDILEESPSGDTHA